MYDRDTFTKDDNMGNAEIDIKPYIECVKKLGFHEGEMIPIDGTEVERVQPSIHNCLAVQSCIVWNKGKLKQDMILRLRDVESGEVEVQIEWFDVPAGSRSALI